VKDMKKEVIRYGLMSDGKMIAKLKDIKSLEIFAKELGIKKYEVIKILE
jgi:hypothetical protein